VILLTVFSKTQRSEAAEIDRALTMHKECQTEHRHAEDVYDREAVMSEHARWERRGCRDSQAVRAGYQAAKRAYELGQAVRARRLELGMSQTELAERAGMTQSAISRLEAGGTIPTIGVLERLAAALSAELVVTLTPRPPDHAPDQRHSASEQSCR
jgi:ribosome-binding protein aMBF1 (putative translation factor)